MKTFLIAALLFVALLAPPLAAQDELSLEDLTELGQTDPGAAFEIARDRIQREENSPNPDRALQLALGTLVLDLYIATQSWPQAADLAAEIGQFVTQYRDQVAADPALFFRRAVEIYAFLGRMDLAMQTNELLMQELALTGRTMADIGGPIGQPNPHAQSLNNRQRQNQSAMDQSHDQFLDQLRDGAPSTGGVGQAAPTSPAPSPQASVGSAPPPPEPSMGSAPPVASDNAVQAEPETPDGKYETFEIFYATDRARTGNTEDPAEFYGSGRGELERGIALVTIPYSHVPGVLETKSIVRFEFRNDPEKHILLESVEPLDPDSFYGRMNARIESSAEREALVFIHGFNVSFENAARRTAQIAFDMDYDGAPILYSWPSRGNVTDYVADTAVVRLSARRLSAFLEEVAARSGADVVHVVAHSMGNRALTDALELMALRRGIKEGDPPLFGQVIFAAPDVDADLFREMLPTIRPIARRLTLYASKSDKALSVSRRLHGGTPRAGIGGEDTLIDEHIDSIDMSELGEDMLDHSYFADDTSALVDIMTLLWRNTHPGSRCGLAGDEGGTLWRYVPGVCNNSEFVKLLVHLRREDAQTLEEAERIMRRTLDDPELVSVIAPTVARIVDE